MPKHGRQDLSYGLRHWRGTGTGRCGQWSLSPSGHHLLSILSQGAHFSLPIHLGIRREGGPTTMRRGLAHGSYRGLSGVPVQADTYQTSPPRGTCG